MVPGIHKTSLEFQECPSSCRQVDKLSCVVLDPSHVSTSFCQRNMKYKRNADAGTFFILAHQAPKRRHGIACVKPDRERERGAANI